MIKLVFNLDKFEDKVSSIYAGSRCRVKTDKDYVVKCRLSINEFTYTGQKSSWYLHDEPDVFVSKRTLQDIEEAKKFEESPVISEGDVVDITVIKNGKCVTVDTVKLGKIYDNCYVIGRFTPL